MTRKLLIHASLLGIALTTLLGGCNREITDQSVKRIPITELSRHLDKVGKGWELLDARDRAAYERSHIPGARHITLPEIDVANPPPHLVGKGTLIVYAENPGSATGMAIAKRLLGITNKVEYMEQGFDAWVAAGLPRTGQQSQ